MGTATVPSKLFIIRHNLYINKLSRYRVRVFRTSVVVNEYKICSPSFTCDVIYLFLHVLYSTLVSMYCNPPLFTCTVLHLVLLILYFTFVYMSCTAQMLTCIVLNPCLSLFTCTVPHLYYMFRTVPLFACILNCTFNYMHCTAPLSTCTVLHLCLHVVFCTFAYMQLFKTAILSVCTVQ